ncbi:MAG: hypothetical protein A2086_17100 [Spirochaetes bacterium GWD1_27_9]|nr:MAG: hypothetical protein A2Z98_17385 [Spirochaetes bacterium GWB1_27_13]OHD26630.1 MAG: hypothetical protein A2Y34_01605 [Spirochaetes bacterium GWC1_27_15]OHD35722.1 MAG: hypothetical protein A2086_17100 [Spirochaetes bacterium GWD1_27_9]
MVENALIKMIQEGYNLPEEYFSTLINKATDIENILYVTQLEQLTDDRFEKFYVDTSKIRENNVINSINIELKNTLRINSKITFAGFTGSGKTTELTKLAKKLENDYNIIFFSIIKRLNSNSITIESFLFEIIEDVLNLISINNYFDEDNNIKEIINNINNWFNETINVTEKDKIRNASLSVGIEFLKKICGGAKLEYNVNKSEKQITTCIEERKIKDLIYECNKIFDYLKEKTGKRNLIIVDDLEKFDFFKVRDFYTKNSAFIKEFKTSMILTIPIELVFHSDYSLIENVFGKAKVLPMIKVKDKNNNEFTDGINVLKEIISKRIDLSLFENECFIDAIKHSGGSLRELFNIINDAVIREMGESSSNKITKKSIEKSITQNKDYFSMKIFERNDEVKITFDQYLDVLIDIYNGNKKEPNQNIALLDLLRIRAVMKYNGEGFYDIHPLLDDFVKSHKEKRENARK